MEYVQLATVELPDDLEDVRRPIRTEDQHLGRLRSVGVIVSVQRELHSVNDCSLGHLGLNAEWRIRTSNIVL